jgi:glycosyltransferase involved in cell wall biosynthesis
VEALASGKPVVALGRGGALETVPFFGGVLYEAPEQDAISGAIARLESIESSLQPADLQLWARQFSEDEFKRRMSAILAPTADLQGHPDNPPYLNAEPRKIR